MSRKGGFEWVAMFQRLQMLGELSIPLTDVAAASYTIQEGDCVVNVSYTDTGAVALTLPAAAGKLGHPIIIKDAGGGAGTYNITISTPGTETIDGASTRVMDQNYEAVTLYTDGSNWFVV